ncbi:hypothetical protein T08_864 [Trichinella sp. T8]|nr:hypothetical protein T08_864 [Trichinella sp. T8]
METLDTARLVFPTLIIRSLMQLPVHKTIHSKTHMTENIQLISQFFILCQTKEVFTSQTILTPIKIMLWGTAYAQ